MSEFASVFKTLFDHFPVGIGLLSLDRMILDVNPTVCRMLGRSSQELIGLPFSAAVFPEDTALGQDKFQEMLDGKRSYYQAERRYQRADGSIFWGRATVSLVRDDQGNPQFAIGMLEDIQEQRSMHEAVRESEARFRTLFDSAAVGIALVGADHRILMVNDALVRMSGFSREELLGINSLDLGHPEDQPLVLPHLDDLAEGRTDAFQVERRYNHKNGDLFWVKQTVSAVRQPDGQLLYLVSIMEDITEQKRSHERMQESNARFKAMFDNASVGIEMVSLDRRYISVNRSVEQISGYTFAELVKMDPGQLSFPEDQEIGMDDFREVAAGRLGGCSIEKRFVRKDGRVIWARVTYSLVRGKDGEPEYLIGMIEENTKQHEAAEKLERQAREYREQLEKRVLERTAELRKANQRLRQEVEQRQRVEAELRLSQALYTEIFDNTPQQIFLVDALPDGRFRIVTTNPAHQQSSGLAPEQIHGKTLDEILPPDVAAQVGENYRECLEAGQPILYEERGPSPFWDSTNIRDYRTTLAPVRDSAGQIIRLVGVTTDITEQKQAEMALAQRAQDEVIAAERNRLARELHDAVTQTLFSASLIAEVLPELWTLDEAAARQSTDELRQLTRGALAEMRTLLLELRPAALTQARLEDLLRQLIEALVGRARLPVELAVSGEARLPPEVQVAFYRIAQESLNNVVKYARPHRVAIQLGLGPGQASLEIGDDGVGFDPTALKPTSLGLRIMRERAEAIGAHLQISSTPGAGTTISVEWKAKEPIGE